MNFILPWPPSANTYWRNLNDRVLISKKGRQFQRLVQKERIVQRIPHIPGLIHITINAYPPDRRRRDLDNIFKPLFDALIEAGIIEDDSLILRIEAVKHPPERPGRVELSLDNP